MVDPREFCSDRLPIEHFDARFSDDNLAFWVPRLVAAAAIGSCSRVLDVGCGTGGFSREIARLTSAHVTGYDASQRFIDFARERDVARAVEWVVGDAEQLPFPTTSFDRVLFSLVLHQLADPTTAVREGFRVLAPGGLVVVRTIAPEDAVRRVPERYLPAMAAADAARLPAVDEVTAWLEEAGFADVTAERHLREKRLSVDEEEHALRTEAQHRYRFLSADDVEAAIRRMRDDANATGGEWIDPRPTYIIVATRPN